MEAKITVIGIGQSLRGDDAAGLMAVRLWQKNFPETASRPEVRVETLELPGLGLLDYLDGMQAAVLVDAIRSPDPAGSLRRFTLRQALAFTSDARSAHGWGVAETLQLGLALNPSLCQCRLILLGLSGRHFQTGAALSPEVEAALPYAAERIEHEGLRSLRKLARKND
jgi:hydrogenase maturation protease